MIDYRKVLVGMAGGVVLAARLDLHAFNFAREKDPSAKFDFKKAVPRWIEGALGGAIVAMGWQAS